MLYTIHSVAREAHATLHTHSSPCSSAEQVYDGVPSEGEGSEVAVGWGLSFSLIHCGAPLPLFGGVARHSDDFTVEPLLAATSYKDPYHLVRVLYAHTFTLTTPTEVARHNVWQQ